MFFGTVSFLIFIGVFFLLYWPVRLYLNTRLIYLLLASLFFYGYWGVAYLPILVGVGLFSFSSGFFVHPGCKYRKLALYTTVGTMLTPLFLFKYLDWCIDMVADAMTAIGLPHDIAFDSSPTYLSVLPLGISFFTFQAVSYTIDVYRGEIAPSRSVVKYLCYLTLFPQLIAGPIVRASEFLDQLDTLRLPSRSDLNEAWSLISRGYFKKLVVADSLGILVNNAFAEDSSRFGSLYWWFVAIVFGWQIYCDFSGYSDIAIGLGLMMGYRFPENFRHPYLATGFRDFWGRWHITLSSWFRDYVYIPLGGSRKNEFRMHLNIWITMLLSGIWHGAAWTFVIWAMIHAFGVSLEHLFRNPKPTRARLQSFCWWAVTMSGVSIAWVFFRASSVEQAMQISRTMLDLSSVNVSDLRLILQNEVVLLLLAFMFTAHGLALVKDRELVKLPSKVSTTWNQFGWSTLLAISLYQMGSSSEFIYFQF